MSERRKCLKLSSPAEIRKALARIVNMVLNDDIDDKKADTMIRGCNGILGAIRTDEQQKKIDELERILIEQNK